MKFKDQYRLNITDLSQKWFNWQQPACPFFLAPCFIATGKKFRDTFKIPFFTSIMYFRCLDDTDINAIQGSWLLRLNEGKSCGQYLVDLFSSRSYQLKFKDEFDSISSELLKLTDHAIKHQDSNETLLEEYKNYIRKFEWFYTLGSITEPVQWATEEILSDVINSSDEDKSKVSASWSKDRKRSSLHSIIEKQYIHEIEFGLVECINEFLGYIKSRGISIPMEQVERKNLIQESYLNNKELTAQIDQFILDFSWKENNYYEAHDLTVEKVIAEISDNISESENLLESKLREVDANHEQILSDREILLKESGNYYSSIAQIENDFGSGLADRRKKIMLQVLKALEVFAKRISDQSGLDIATVKMAMPEEVEGILTDPSIHEKRLCDRKLGFAIQESPFPILETEITSLLNDENIDVPSRVYSTYAEGDNLGEFFQEIDIKLQMTVKDSQNVIKGDIAFKPKKNNKLIGKVRIIRFPTKEKLIENEILVATSTTPDFMRHIRKSSAIITDQSGMTTHAALTARELQIPCIIGTSIGSHVLKTGDTIELNFDTGEIKII